jgi:hypothetical protein
MYRKIIIYHYYPIRSANIYTYFQVVGISRSTGGGNSKVKWWGYRGQVAGELQNQVVVISRSTAGGKRSRSSGRGIEVKWWGYRGQVVGISRSSDGDIKVKGKGALRSR